MNQALMTLFGQARALKNPHRVFSGGQPTLNQTGMATDMHRVPNGHRLTMKTYNRVSSSVYRGFSDSTQPDPVHPQTNVKLVVLSY